MKKYSCRHVPILNREAILVGIVSHTDLLEKKSNRVISLMSKEVLTCYDHVRIQEIARILLHNRFGAIPIIDHTHNLVGIITLSDILYHVVRNGKLDKGS